MRRRATSVAAAAAVLLASCGGGSDGAAAPEPEPGDVEVRLVGLRFEPERVEVPVGKQVVWRWTDRVAHNVVEDEARFTGSKVLSGGTYVIRFTEAGTYRYECTLHDGMVGTVVAR